MTHPNLKLVSSNAEKLNEFRYLLGVEQLVMAQIKTKEYQDLNLEEIVRHKIEEAKKVLPDTPFFVEHSGLEIDGWKQLPGGLTGVFMQTVGPAGICRMLEGFAEKDRNATAVSIIGFYDQGNSKIFRGTAYGRIAASPSLVRERDWDWDAIFIPDDGSGETYSEMGFVEKNRISMRRKAADDFLQYLKRYYELAYYPAVTLDPDRAAAVRDLVRDGRLRPALDELDQALQGTREHNAVLSLTARANVLERDQRAGVLLRQEYDAAHSKIVRAVLELVENLAPEPR